MACSLEPVIKCLGSKGRGLLPGLRTGNDGAAEAAAELLRAQNKQHGGSVMRPPIKSKGYFFLVFWLFYNPAFASRETEEPCWEGHERFGKDWDS